ncbi:hypothetical protein JCM33374_g2188 [Metschnikowia sp. JCM 33374]|nr:hypothetical protein JCM33374_g2188 [Metschnikowia sp. JCM 33374]
MRQYLIQGQESDSMLGDIYKSIEMTLEAYCGGQQSLLRCIPKNGHIQLDQAGEQVSFELRSLLSEVSNLESKRERFEAAVDLKSRNHSILSVVVDSFKRNPEKYQNPDGSIDQAKFEPVYEQHITFFNPDLAYLAQSKEQQVALEKKIDEVNQRFDRVKASSLSKSQEARLSVLQKLENDYVKYLELVQNLNSASKFYTAFLDRGNCVLKELDEYLLTRREEARELAISINAQRNFEGIQESMTRNQGNIAAPQGQRANLWDPSKGIRFSIELAKSINGEIINADSMQVYRGAPIITNKHPMNERGGIPHHVMDHIPWNEEYFIHRYSAEALGAIEDIHARGKTPIIIGGTHYYLQNLLFKNKTIGEKEEKEKLKPLTSQQQELLDGPVDAIFKALTDVDPVISEKFHPKDTRKLRRALEIYYTTGQKPSEMYHEQKLDELEDSSLKYNTLLFWIYCDPEVLKERLDKRVDSMMETGALEEIRELNEFYESQSPSPDMATGIWQVIGYKEFRPWLTGGQTDVKLFEEGVERMKIRTRQYAKYQVKWIKKLLGVELNKESRFSFKYGGKMYLLDATDLSQWATTVSTRGLAITEQFIKNGPLGVTEAQAPENLKSTLPTSEFYEEFNSNKTIKAVNNWKHHECPVCKDSEGKPLVAVGEDNWLIHVKSRRHKKQLSYNEKKRKHEELVLKYKKVKEDITA